jgi:HD-GYP domain-containing protein (c-di-GMP phosphodiesterase class II)
LASGLALLARTWTQSNPELTAFLLVVAVLAALSEHFAPQIGSYAISLALPLAVCAMLLWGPFAAAVVAGASVISTRAFSSRRTLLLTSFNMGQLILVTLAAGWSYLALGGRLLFGSGVMLPLGAQDFPRILVPMAASAIVLAAGNVLMTSVGGSVLYRMPVRDLLEGSISHVPSLAALATVGFLMAQVTATSAAALLLFIFPLIVARDMYQRFKSLKGAYADTIRSLVGALEAKDFYTRGHSERVAGYAVALGRAMGLDAKACDRLEYAGLLHDLGKIALPATILTKPGALTDEEMDMMKGHPAAGASMVGRIPPLAELADLVLHHHERYEGGGYPDGLHGVEVPRLARILTVADAYDAMTTNRAYRPAMSHERAREIVAQAGGSQFDPDVVQVFLRIWSELAPVSPEDEPAPDDEGAALSGLATPTVSGEA